MPLHFGRTSSGLLVPIQLDDNGKLILSDVNALPAGDNNIGNVDVASIAAGNNNIGNVDVVTLPNLPGIDDDVYVRVNAIPPVDAQSYGWVNAKWQKNPILLGYSDTKVYTGGNASLSAGINTVDSDTVPTGEIWVVNSLYFRYTGTITGVEVRIYYKTGPPVFMAEKPPTAGVFHTMQSNITLKPTDYLEWWINGATAGDAFLCGFMAVRIDTDQ